MTIILIILCIGLVIFTSRVQTNRFTSLQEQFDNDGEWECIEREQVTYRECEKLVNLEDKELLEDNHFLNICRDNYWYFDCPKGLYLSWDENGDILDAQTDYNQNKCKEERIYYGGCIKWQKIKFSVLTKR